MLMSVILECGRNSNFLETCKAQGVMLFLTLTFKHVKFNCLTLRTAVSGSRHYFHRPQKENTGLIR